MKIVYSALYGGLCYPFGGLADEVKTVKDPEQMTEKDSVLIVWGGADINPKYYGHKQSHTTYCYESRDSFEWACIQRAIKLGIPMIGVCRGAQMMCAAAGGFLIQDVSGHAGGRHNCDTYDGSVISINSIHHQMMAGLENVEHEMLAWSSPARSNHYTWKDDVKYSPVEGFKEAEMVYFTKIKALAVQWHPEGMDDTSPATKFVLKEFGARHGSVGTANASPTNATITTT